MPEDRSRPAPDTAASASTPARRAFVRVMPGLFVLLWSTGFIGAKFGLPYVEPFTFLAVRFLLALVLLAPLAWAARAAWPKSPAALGHQAVTGTLVHAVYLGGVFWAIDHGLSAGVAALIVGLQPLLTAVAVGPLLGERVSARQWLGLVLGLTGVAMVVGEKLGFAGTAGLAGLEPIALTGAVLALLGITAGTLYQKRFGGSTDLRAATFVQYAAAAVVMGVASLALETGEIQWTGEFVFALGWLTLVLSLGAISLLMTLIRLGEAARVASLFYLVPPVTAVTAWALFGETLGALALAGMAVAVVGVALVVARRS
ncbi:Permease of the drug/metabolite transporter (DMT) superfamily [Caenispirillum salinarum AK4]|uniref:Permease of the drug/metabolite transporter (DMT) superfamily n=1 Tax=Caenispirillum salinarum AK4 TaxID=1238182 RepID=K9HMQ8_9PROT|nr:Permease of the drug/metabolite transporter (DMT) superfamily [Caenispirillum salinarum AK4]